MKIIQKMKTWLYSFKFNKSSEVWSGMSVVAPDIIKEDTRTKDAIKRVVNAFDQQKVNMEMMAKKQHSADCPVNMCDKTPCFERKSDIIIGKPKKVVAKKSVAIRNAVK